jgi:hypothetical protein
MHPCGRDYLGAEGQVPRKKVFFAHKILIFHFFHFLFFLIVLYDVIFSITAKF